MLLYVKDVSQRFMFRLPHSGATTFLGIKAHTPVSLMGLVITLVSLIRLPIAEDSVLSMGGNRGLNA